MKSVLLINGNDPRALLNSTLYGADALAYDLHDSVDAADKDAARLLMQEALTFLDFGQAGVFVRVNPLDGCGAEDIAVTGKGKPQAFILPKADPDSVRQADAAIAGLESENGFASGSIRLIPTLDSVGAVANVTEVLAASPRVMAAVFSAREFLADLGVPDSGEGDQLLCARSQVAMACRMSGILSIDRPYYDVKNAAGFEADAARARSLGFSAKLAVSGGQVPVINCVFA